MDGEATTLSRSPEKPSFQAKKFCVVSAGVDLRETVLNEDSCYAIIEREGRRDVLSADGTHPVRRWVDICQFDCPAIGRCVGADPTTRTRQLEHRIDRVGSNVHQA